MRAFSLLLPVSLLLGATAIIASAPAAHGQEQEKITVLRSLLGEDADRAALGISTESTGKRDTLGLLIESITPNSPADKAGLQEGNRIASINGVSLKLAPADAGQPDMNGLMTRRLTRELRKVKSGDEVTLDVYADGRYKTVKVKTVALEDIEGRGIRFSRDEMNDRAVVGLTLGGGGNRRDTLGVLVIGVADNGPADKAGIEEGNRIQAINGVDLRVPADEAEGGALVSAKVDRFTRELRKVKAGDAVELKVYADGKVKTVKVTTARAGDVYEEGRGRNGAFRFNFGGDGMELMPSMAPMPPMPPMPPIRFTPMVRTYELRTNTLGQLERAMRDARVETLRAQRQLRAAAEQSARAAVAAAWADGGRLRPRVANAVWTTENGGVDDGRVTIAGLQLSPVSDGLASYFGKGSEDGLLVLDTGDRWAPLRSGDVILSVNGKPVRTADGTSISLSTDRDNSFVVLRKGKKETVVVKRR